MKLNITVEIDWIEEDGNIDEEVKYEIINGVKNAISKDCLKQVQAIASKEINQAISDSITEAKEKIDQQAMDFAKNWLENTVVVTDKWGNKGEVCSIRKLIEKSFDNTLHKKVDKHGRFDNYGIPLISEYIQNVASGRVDDMLRNLSPAIDKEVKNQINNQIKEKVANKFAEMVVSGK